VGKVEHPLLCSAPEAAPQKVALSASRNLSRSARGMLFLKVQPVLCSALVGVVFSLPSSPITFIFQTRPAACVFDKYLSSTVKAHRLKNDL